MVSGLMLHDPVSHHEPKWIPVGWKELMRVSFTEYTHCVLGIVLTASQTHYQHILVTKTMC